MGARGIRGAGRPGAAVIVALLALVFQALIPPGYMLAAGRDASPVLSICTGHGAMALGDSTDRQSPPLKQKAAGPCAFAGHGAPPILAASVHPIAIAWSLAAPAGPVAHPRVIVGRGLAAPPPARGPPSALI